MSLRTQLTLLFIILVAIIITMASISIYYFSAEYREDDFYNRLTNKGVNTAKLLIEVEEVDVDLLRRIETGNPISLPQEKISIYNYRNDILYTTDDNNEFQVNSDLLDKIRLESRVRFKQGPYEALGLLYSDEFDRFVVVIGAVDIYGLGKLKNLRFILVIVLIASIILVSIAGWIYTRRALKPISRVIENVKEITITSLNLRVDDGNKKDELAQLAQTFNEMLDRLESAFLTQKNFIANASHELRTPLTAITGQLEVSMMKSRSAEEYQQTVKSVLEDIKNLNLLANRLLLLAQSSSDNSKANFKPHRIDELIWQVREEVVKRHSDYEVLIDLDETLDDESKLIIPGDEQMLKTLISNLIDNGCKFSTDHKVRVIISAQNGTLDLAFHDQGIGISEEELEIVFEPFHRGKNATKIKGHGIGLSLVDSIVKSHQGTIQVESKLNQGTIFKISLPFSA